MKAELKAEPWAVQKAVPKVGSTGELWAVSTAGPRADGWADWSAVSWVDERVAKLAAWRAGQKAAPSVVSMADSLVLKKKKKVNNDKNCTVEYFCKNYLIRWCTLENRRWLRRYPVSR